MENLLNKTNKKFDNLLLPLNLQFFAEGEESDQKDNNESNPKGDETKPEAVETNAQPEVLTKDDVLKLIQSETDKVRTEYSKKLKDKDKELEKLRVEKMTDEEKLAHERELLEQENAQLKQEKLRYIAIEQLAKHSMPVEVVEFVVADNEDSTIERISKFKQVFEKAVTEKASEMFKGQGTKHVTGVGAGSSMTKQEFEALSLTERTKLANENPELYKQLKQL